MHQSSPSPTELLDPRLSRLLEGLRTRVRRYVVWDSLLALAAIVLGAFWIGLALDYLPVLLGGTEMPRLARLLLLVTLTLIFAYVVAKVLWQRLQFPLPDDSLALLVERHHPDLGGRLVTAVQLNRPGRSGDSHSPKLLRHVHDEVAGVVDRVDPAKVFRAEPLIRKAAIVVPLLLMAMILLATSPQAFGRALMRLTLISDEPWPRRAQLEMVGVELPVVSSDGDQTVEPVLVPFEDGVVRLPRGSSGTLRIRAKDGEESEVPVVCTVYYRTVISREPGESVDRNDLDRSIGSTGQSNMRRVGRVIDGYQSFLLDGAPLEGLNQSIEFDVRGLDDRLDNYRIEAVTPPAITQMMVRVRYPDYLSVGGDDPPWDLETPYQSGLRLPEGSRVTLVASSSKPLGETDITVLSSTNEPMSFSTSYPADRGQLSVELPEFSQTASVAMVPKDDTGISAQAPYRYFLGIVLDEPPELKIDLQGIGTAVTPIAKIPVLASAQDDYGIDQVSVSLARSASDTDAAPDDQADRSATSVLSIDRDGKAKTSMDLRELVINQTLPELTPDDAINLIGEATDRYDLGPSHVTRSEVYRLRIVTPEDLLALLERRELGLRSRLEQTITEMQGLRESLSSVRVGLENSVGQPATTTDPDPSAIASDQRDEQPTRADQLRRLRVQQSELQASKTTEELTGIAASLDDILLEMINNRVDSIDRRERIGQGVRDPLEDIVAGPLTRLESQISSIEQSIGNDAVALKHSTDAVQTVEEVLLGLTAVLERMLDLESYNEILDLVRGLIDDQDGLIEDTKSEQKKRVLDLFQ